MKLNRPRATRITGTPSHTVIMDTVVYIQAQLIALIDATSKCVIFISLTFEFQLPKNLITKH